jgi:two-component sensor histidine kinase
MIEMNILAHEIINPLNIIVGCAELSKVETDLLKNNKIASYLNTIVSQSMKCCQLLEQQIKEQHENMNIGHLDLSDLLIIMINSLNDHPFVTSSKKKFILEKDTSKTYDITILNENKCYLKIVINNMLMNAVKHSSCENGNITISINHLPQNKLELRIVNCIDIESKNATQQPEEHYFTKSHFLGLNIIDSLVKKINADWNMIQDDNSIITSLIL